MFEISKSVYIKNETAVTFGVIEKKVKDSVKFEPKFISEKQNQVIVNCLVNDKKENIVFSKNVLTKGNKVFIAWVYLLLKEYKNDKEYKSIASDYLKDALKEELESDFSNRKREEWAFPFYLISNDDLEVSGLPNIRNRMYRFLKEPKPLFLDFYKEVLRREKNKVRKVQVAKIAEQFYPDEEWFVSEISDDLVSQKKHKECIAYLLSVKKRVKKEVWQSMYARVRLWECYIKTKDYKKALQELEMPISAMFNENITNFLTGVTYTHTQKWNIAISYFEKAIFEDFRDDSYSIISNYFLIKCYLATKNYPKVDEIISGFELKRDEVFNYSSPFPYREEALKIISLAVKSKNLSELSVSKLNGILGYLTYEMLPISNEPADVIRNLTKSEKKQAKKSLELIKLALETFPQEVFFNSIASNLLNYEKRFDEAMDYKIKTLFYPIDFGVVYVNTDLKDCSLEYLNNYAKKVKNTFDYYNRTPEEYVSSYEFDSAVGALWVKRDYQQIVDLYLFVEPYIEDFSKIGEIRQYNGGGGLFEIAYSFSEVGRKDKASILYEKELKIKGESSSVLNNLAIIYEKTGELKKAKSFITRAKALDKEDDVISKNYSRIVGSSPIKDKHKTEVMPVLRITKESVSFDGKSSEIVFGSKKCPIPMGTNQFILCEKIFSFPAGEWLKEEDVVDNFSRGIDSNRGFYDAIRLVNQKVESELKIKKLLLYKANRVQVRQNHS